MSDTDVLNLVLLVLRVATGAMLFAHGWVHLKRVRQGPGVANWFASLGMRQPVLNAWVVTLVEIVGGAMLAFGLLTPLAAASVTGVALVAWITNHWSAGFFVYNRPTEGWEYVMILTALGIALGTLGAGEWSLDDAFGIDWEITTNFWVTVVAGVGGGLGQLAVFWRPPPRAEPSTD